MPALPIAIASDSDMEIHGNQITQLAACCANELHQELWDSFPTAPPALRKRIVSLVEAVMFRALIDDSDHVGSPDVARIWFCGALRDRLEKLEEDTPFAECDDVHDAAADAIRAIDARLARRDLKLQDQIGLSAKFADMLGDAYVCDA